MEKYGRISKSISLEEMRSLRIEGKFLQLDDIVLYVLSWDIAYAGKRQRYKLTVRELFSGEIATIHVMQYTPTPLITYTTSCYRPNAEKSEYSERYSQDIRNPVFYLLDLDLRVCIYKGNYACVDLGNGKEYSFEHSTRKVKKELDGVEIGDTVSVGIFQNIAFFLASYKYGNPELQMYRSPQQVILKRAKGFKRITVQPGTQYVVRSIKSYNFQAEKEYSRSYKFSYLGADICEEVTVTYGYVYGFRNDAIKEIYFTRLADSKIFEVPKNTVGEKTFEYLCKRPYVAGAHITGKNPRHACLTNLFWTQELGTLQYSFTDGGSAYCMDMETYELYEIPLCYMPKGIKENELLSGSFAKDEELKAVNRKGEVFILHKL